MCVDLDTPIGYRFTTDPKVLGYGTRDEANVALAFFHSSKPGVVGMWRNMPNLEDQVWVRNGWYMGGYGAGVHVRHERCIEVDGVWRTLTQDERNALTTLSCRPSLSPKKK